MVTKAERMSEEKQYSGLSEGQKKIFEYIIEHPCIASKEISGLFGISPGYTTIVIAKLKNMQLIKRIGGKKKGSYWRINWNKIGKNAEMQQEPLKSKRSKSNIIYLSDTQKTILRCMKKNPHIKSNKIPSLVGMTEINVKNNIPKLKEKGVLERIGGNRKNGYWKVNWNDVEYVTEISQEYRKSKQNKKIVTENFSGNQKKILEYMIENPSVKITEISTLMGTSAAYICMCITRFKKKGFLERIGNQRNGYWKMNWSGIKKEVKIRQKL